VTNIIPFAVGGAREAVLKVDDFTISNDSRDERLEACFVWKGGPSCAFAGSVQQRASHNGKCHLANEQIPKNALSCLCAESFLHTCRGNFEVFSSEASRTGQRFHQSKICVSRCPASGWLLVPSRNHSTYHTCKSCHSLCIAHNCCHHPRFGNEPSSCDTFRTLLQCKASFCAFESYAAENYALAAEGPLQSNSLALISNHWLTLTVATISNHEHLRLRLEWA